MSHFVLNLNGIATTTTATTTQISLSENQTYIFSVKAIDKFGNESEKTTQEIQISQRPVVINEVAWAGTGSGHSSDEWIELYNNTNSDINLDNWTLYAEDQKPYISLSGIIPAKGYYLLERTDVDTVSDIAANLIYTGALGNSGEHLTLAFVSDNATTTVDEILKSPNWRGNGSNNTYVSMERYDSTQAGDDWNNWGSNLGEFILNGKSASGTNIFGTPGAKNSISYMIANGMELNENKTLTKENSPYLIGRIGGSGKGEFKVNENITLTIESGVVIKFASLGTSSLISPIEYTACESSESMKSCV